MAALSSQDLGAVVESTFAIIFFGTPHRGSDYADFGKTVIRLVSILAGTPGNARIVKNLTDNTEILTHLRKTFDSTMKFMAQTNRFGSSTFQEGRGLSSVRGFRGKVSFYSQSSTVIGNRDIHNGVLRRILEVGVGGS